ncbi:GNAT family N-acetyltransferase [Ensifer soli]|uniref:GNAT family N-acetyltransferase n=1 Tax=Ciceribacter sp. sgz301302 TaxID=3342379 RepID=UPI0035B7080F
MPARALPVLEADAAPAAAPDCRIAVARGLAAFLGLKDAWDDLHRRAALPHQVFQSPGFLAHWIRHYPGAGEIVLVTGTIDGRLAMVWPLMLTRRFGIARLTIMGAPVAQFFDVLVEEGPEAARLLAGGWQAVERLGADVFVVHHLRADTRLATLAGIRRSAGPAATTAPFADLSLRVSGGEPGPAYSARERSNHRRRLRRLAEQGSVALEAIAPGEAAAALAAEAVRFKTRSLLRKTVWSPAVMSPRFAAFFEALARDPSSPLRVSAIRCDGRAIGIELALDWGGHAFGHVLATDPDFPLDGIGCLLIHHTFACAARRGARVFELMAPADPYKLHHADGRTEVFDVAIAFTTGGALYRDVWLRRVAPFARHLVRNVAGPVLRSLLGGGRRRAAIPAAAPALYTLEAAPKSP